MTDRKDRIERTPDGYRTASHVIDPVCAIHGKRWSEHPGGRCLYCCLCFKPLVPSECHVLPDGTHEDVCNDCAAEEEAYGGDQAGT